MTATESVMIVDDDQLFRGEMAASLRTKAVSAIPAAGVDEALGIIQANPGIVVAVIDLRMPDVDGVDAARQIQEERPDIAVIFLSGYDSAEFRARAVEHSLRVECWIDKGPTAELLVQKVADAVSRVLVRHVLLQVRRLLNMVDKGYPFSPEQRHLIEAGMAAIVQQAPVVVRTGQAPDCRTLLELAGDQPAAGDALEEINICLDELLMGHRDPAHRELVWDRLQRTSEQGLWKTVEASGWNKYAQQIAIQMKLAIRRISAPQLTADHINALYVCLERLRSERVERTDVVTCKQQLHISGVDTLPSFHKVVVEWDALNREEHAQKEPEESASGDDDSDAQTGGRA